MSFEDGVFSYPVPSKRKGVPRHECQKPVGLFKEIIEILSDPDDLVLDPFAGSGTTGVAAEQADRRHIQFEEMDKWCEVATARWEEASGHGGGIKALARAAKYEVPPEMKLVPPSHPLPRQPMPKVRLKR